MHFLITFFSILRVYFCQELCNQTSIQILDSQNPVQIKDEVLDDSILNFQETYSYALWINYQPFRLKKPSIIYYIFPVDVGIESYFIFAESTTIKNQQSIVLSLNVDVLNKLITFHLQVQSANQFNQFDISIDPLKFEGKWILFNTYYNLPNKVISFYFYDINEMINSFSIQDYPNFANKMRYTLGGIYTYYTQEGKQIDLQQFPGKQTNRFIILKVIDNKIDNCKPSELFTEFIKNLTEKPDQILTFDGQKYQQSVYNVSVECKKLEVKGWVKLNSLSLNSQDTETILLRITINSEFNDDTLIGDKFLYIKYYQSLVMQNNYISITTFSYKFPKKGYYTSQPLDTIQIKENFLQQAMTEWHYFRFEQHRDDMNFPLFTIGFPSVSQVVKMSWTEPKRYFTGTFFYYFIGGDYFSSHYLQGQIYNIQLHGCYDNDIEFKLDCHYSCKLCNGPSEYQCTQCSDQSNRIYQSSQMSCLCKLGYVDIDNNPICQAINTIYPQIQLIEIQKGCNKEGFDDCEDIKCSIGYFQIQNQCIKCPEQDEFQSSLKLNCGDCYIFPKSFQRLCTFDMVAYNFLEQNVYQNKVRDQQNYSYYNLIQLNGQYYLTLCPGCLNEKECKPTYYRSNGKCLKCSEGCYQCQNELQCTQCLQLDGYLPNTTQGCQKCSQNCETCVSPKSHTLQPLCTKCAENYFSNPWGNCIKCGAFCSSCNLKRCYQCFSHTKYFITMDGQNCARCLISNCKYCFQFITSQKGEIITSTLDFEFNSTDLNSQEIFTGCAYCENNRYYNIQTLQCEEITAYVPVVEGSTSSSGVSSSQIVSSNPFICLTGIIDKDMKQCLIHNSSDALSIQNTDCSTILNCKSCIIENTISFSYCVICNDGYYSLLSKGTCIACPQNCRTCIQQNINYKDSWKHEIMAFYQYFLNTNNDHYYTNFGKSKDSSDYEIICTSCIQGQILYKDACIQGCNTQCLNCQIIQGTAQCIQCPPTQYGVIRSVDNNNSNCIQCSKFCQACFQRDDISNINPFYIGNQKYQNFCYRDYQNRNDNVNLFNQFGTLTACKSYKKCQNNLLIKYDVYCSQNDFEKAQFTNKNSISIYNLRKQGFDSLNKDGFYDYLNQITVKNITFQLNFVLGDSPACFFPTNLDINTSLFHNVFALENLEIIFMSQNQIPFQVQELAIHNFTQISFINITFLNSPETSSYISVTNNYKPIETNLFNITIISSKFTFFQTSSKITRIENMIIKQVKMMQGIMLYILPYDYLSNNFQLTNLLIEDSTFQDFFIFYFLCFDGKKIINNIKIRNSKFNNSMFIYTYFTQQNLCGEVLINQFYAEDLQIQSSKFINVPAASKMTISVMRFEDSKINNSIILALNVVDINDFSLQKSQIINSTIISNQIDKIITPLSQYLNQIKFKDNVYNNAKAFINLQTTNNIFIRGIQLQSNIIDQQTMDVSFEDSLIYIQCLKLEIDGLKVDRAYGYPEFTVRHTTQILIKNGIFEMLPQFWTKTLQPSVSCIWSHLNMMEVFVIYIDGYQNIELLNIKSNNMLLINYPLIMIKSKDIMQTIQNDIIQISNCLFSNNVMLLTSTHRSTSLIQISSQQELLFKMENTTFTGNLLNEYIQDLTQYSTATILLQSISGQAIIKHSNFYSNVVSNSTDAILLINQDSIYIKDSNFQNNNILEFSQIQDKILYSNEYILTQSDILQYFTISSNSGNGFLIMANLQLINVFVNNSYGVSAGGFMLTAQNEAYINVDNCQFNNTQTSINLIDQSKGGTLCIDASKAKLYLSISNTKISNSYSRYQGGGIYLDPSKTYNILSFLNISVINSFSFQGMFLYLQCTEQVLSSQIAFVNSSFTNNENYFNKFIGLFKDLQIAEIEGLVSDNPIIKTYYSDFRMMNCSLSNSFLGFFIDAEYSYNVIIENVKIINTTIFYAPILKLSLNLDQQTSKLTMNKISITNTTQKQKIVQKSCFNPVYSTIKKSDWKCPNIILDTDLIDIQNVKQEHTYIDCNLQLIFAKNYTFNLSLIEIEISRVSTVSIKNIELLSNDCIYCTNGLIGFQSDSQLVQQNQIKLQNLEIINNVCGIYGCITITNEDIPANILQQSNKRILQEDIYLSKVFFIFLIRQLTCVGNKAEYGGCVFIYNSLVLIIDAVITNNTAVQIGGGIFYYGENNIKLYNVEINNNSANIAGGIYTTGQFPLNLQPLKVYIFNNKGLQSNYEIQEHPRSLTISLDGGNTMLQKQIILTNSSHFIEEIKIKPYKILGTSQLQSNIHFPSGQPISSYKYFDKYTLSYIPYNLTFRLIALNKFNQKEPGLKNTKCYLKSEDMHKESDNNRTLVSKTEVQFNDSTNDYNLDELIIYFNPQSNRPLNLRFNCHSIQVPIFDQQQPYELQYTITNYYLNVKIETFKCQLGEYYNQTSEACTLCQSDIGQYSVQENAYSCKFKDEVTMKNVKSALIELKKGYWRPFIQSEKIEQCYHLLENCLGGWKPGTDSCTTGHIGALCEQCDLYNTRLQGSFSVSGLYQCGNCQDVTINIVTIIFISLWALVSIILSVNSTIKHIGMFIIALKVKQYGVKVITIDSSTAILIKVFTNYLQIISTISTFSLQVPSGIASAVNSVGNPLQSIAYSLDCFLILLTNIDILYFRLIWSFIMAFLYIGIFFLTNLILMVLKKAKYNITLVTTTFIYMYIYLQPDVIGGLVSLTSFRVISDEPWIQGNVAYRYQSQQHLKWLLIFVLPLLILLGLVIPIVMFLCVYINRFKLDKIYNRCRWGYLYNEYRHDTYFWETIKILQKEFIIIALTFYEDYVPIKAALVFLLLFFYSFATNKYKPYMTVQMNFLDSQSTIFCSVSIVLASTIYVAQNKNLNEIVWPCYIMIGILNGLFILKLVIKIIFGYFDKLYSQIDWLKDKLNKKYPTMQKKYKFLKYVFDTRQQKQERIKKRYKMLKNHLLRQARLLIQFKKNQQFMLPEINSLSSNMELSSRKSSLLVNFQHEKNSLD